VTAKMEVMRKRRRPRKRWTDEVEEDLKIMGIRDWLQRPETRRSGGGFF
jgi:hypothetical protein